MKNTTKSEMQNRNRIFVLQSISPTAKKITSVEVGMLIKVEVNAADKKYIFGIISEIKNSNNITIMWVKGLGADMEYYNNNPYKGFTLKEIIKRMELP